MKAKADYVPAMSDSSVKEKTRKDWATWFTTLDQEGAAAMDHKTIVRVLSDKYAVPSWWRQMVAVEYERARGLRVPHQTATGFSVAISKTLAADISRLYAATADVALRKKWFPPGEFDASSKTQDKYCRGSWNSTARLEFGFLSKGESKAQIAVQVSRLRSESDVEAERAAWKAALLKLQSLLQQSPPTSAG